MSLRFKLVWAATIAAVSLCCGTPTVFLCSHVAASNYFYSLFLPHYPDSQLVSREEGGGSHVGWVKTIYRTTDSQDEVLSFMDKQMPGFTLEKEDRRKAPTYSNSICAYEISLGRYLYGRGDYPCVSVSIYPDAEANSGILIEVFEEYPLR